MIKTIFSFFLVISLITSCKSNVEANVSNSLDKSNLKNKVSYLKLPIDYSFSIKKETVKGNIFFDEKEKLTQKISENFIFTKEKDTLNVKSELCNRYRERCESYFNEFDYSKSYSIDTGFNFDLYLITSKYNDCLNLISTKENEIIDILNIHLNYLDYEGQECIYRNFSIDKNINISVFDYIYYESIGEVEEGSGENDYKHEYPSATLKKRLYKVEKNGRFIKI